jgi:hypothetical protein
MITKEDYEVGLDKLKDKWSEKGEHAGGHDGWMRPCVDEVDVEYYKEGHGAVAQRDEEGWEETDHFALTYSKYMWADVFVLFGRESLHDDGVSSYESEWMIEAWQDLKAAFWEGYHNTANTYDLIEKQMKKLRKEGLLPKPEKKKKVKK